ncbi:MAG: hypothetical protein J0H82_18590 [Alphaproteobacteria bacterium]|jgi:hypothetical protein|nr:hypothetical protein [Alphaproteobacteria bacterium]
MTETTASQARLWRVGDTPIMHDGETYQPGTAIQLDDDAADELGTYLDGLADETTVTRKKGAKK